MALVLVTTPGAADANAYCDRATAAVIAEEIFPAPTAWTNSSNDDQNRTLVAATRRLDEERWRGEPASETQALQCPRQHAPALQETGAFAPNDLFEDDESIPDRVERATALLAFELARLVEAGHANPLGPVSQPGVSSLSIGSEFSASFEQGQASIPPVERFIAQVIRPVLGNLVLAPQMRMVRG